MDPVAMLRVQKLLSGLPFRQQEELHAFLTALLTPAAVERTPMVATVTTKEATYWHRSEWVRCGKPTCACRDGRRHGPYVYKYWRQDGRLRKAYVGKGVQPDRRPTGKPRA